jgi:tRNA U38,U39,U40 pseudouridine synthase TruA
MIDVSRRKRQLSDIIAALENQNRALASPLVPPIGLDLHKIYYNPPFDFIN